MDYQPGLESRPPQEPSMPRLANRRGSTGSDTDSDDSSASAAASAASANEAASERRMRGQLRRQQLQEEQPAAEERNLLLRQQKLAELQREQQERLLSALRAQNQPSQQRPRPQAAPPGLQHPLRILLVEDEDANIVQALHVLAKLGYNADVARDGTELVEKMRGNTVCPYDVVILDLALPQMNGFEAMEWMLKQFANKESRPTVITVTSSKHENDLFKCLQLTIEYYIAKPLTPKELWSRLSLVSRLRR